jgi:hypothetical protein
MSRIPRFVSFLVLAIALASCGAAQPGASLVPAMPIAASATRASKGVAPLTIALPTIQAAGSTIDWSSKPNLLSQATRSISGSIGSRPFGPIALSASQAGCAAATGGLSCAISVHAPAGRAQSLVLWTYATTNGIGKPLATATATLNIYRSQKNYAAPAVYGIARSVGVRARDAVVHQGAWLAEPLLVYGIDAARQTIPSTAVVDGTGAPVESVSIKLSGFVNETITGDDGNYSCCGIIPPIFAYDGLALGTETFAAQATGLPARTNTLKALPGPATPLATLITSSSYHATPYYVSFVGAFASNANGNAAPLRTFVPAAGGQAFGEDAEGNFWVGSTHYSNAGKVLGTVALPAQTSAVARDKAGNLYALSTDPAHCAAYEYRAGRYGHPAPIREIDFSNCDSANLTVDDAGNVYISIDSQTYGQPNAEIFEYAARSGSGTVAPMRTITSPSTGYNAFSGLATDAAGNLYALYVGSTPSQLLEFAPGSTTGTPLLAGVSVQSFAVDDAGGIYARVYSAPGTGSLDYFPPGSSTPAQVIVGSATQLYDVGAVVVPRT